MSSSSAIEVDKPLDQEAIKTKIEKLEAKIAQTTAQLENVQSTIIKLIVELNKIEESQNNLDMEIKIFMAMLPNGPLVSIVGLPQPHGRILNEMIKRLADGSTEVLFKTGELKVYAAQYEQIGQQLMKMMEKLNLYKLKSVSVAMDVINGNFQNQLNELQNNPEFNLAPTFLMKHKKISEREVKSLALENWLPTHEKRVTSRPS